MRALVVYESIFGNTRRIAEAIGTGLSRHFDAVEVVEVSSAPAHLQGIDLLVVGGPTHVWGMSRAHTRKGATEQAHQKGIEPVSPGIGVREWLQGLDKPQAPLPAAVFDTALRRTGWFPTGSAAKAASSLLLRAGYHLIARPEQFRVQDTEGPLQEGERERALAWGAQLFLDLQHLKAELAR